jgi:hypothetical protein
MHVREGVDHWNRAATVKCGGRAAASGELDPAPDVSRRPGKSPLLCLTALFHLGCYKRWLASLGSYSWLFLLRIHPSEPSHSSLTHLAWLIHHLVRLESIQVHCFEWLHLEALGDCVSLWDSLITLGGCRHLDGLVQRGSLSGGRWLSPALIGGFEGVLCLLRGRSRKATLVDCSWLVDPHLMLVVRHSVAG